MTVLTNDGGLVEERVFNLIDHYQQFFRITLARTPEEKALAYQLRHKVFRLDCGFEQLGKFSTQDAELDEFEKNALHVLLHSKESKATKISEPIGYIRLVIANGDDLGLPIESHYFDEYEYTDLPYLTTPIAKTGKRCEISRIAIVKSYRQRQSDRIGTVNSNVDRRRQIEGANITSEPGLMRRSTDAMSVDAEKQLISSRRFPVNYLPLCLIFAVIHLIINHGFEYAFAITEKKIIRFFSYYGIKFYPIGHAIDYNGPRVPFILNVKESILQIKEEYRQLFDVIGNELQANKLLK